MLTWEQPVNGQLIHRYALQFTTSATQVWTVTLNRIVRLVGFFASLLLGDSTALSDTSARHQVPPAALESAQKCLDDWKVRCTANPTFYGLKDADAVPKARLETAFVEYILRGNQLNEYVSSASYDPRPYASLTMYVYPIVIEDDFAGGLVVSANQVEDGSLIDSTLAHSAYACISFYPATKQRGKLEECRRRFPVIDGYMVEFVRVVGGTTNIIVTDGFGKVFVLEDNALVPLSQAGIALKAMASTADDLRLKSMQLQKEK